MEFHPFVYILLLLTVKTDKMELMIGDNLINNEHSVPIIITSNMIVKSFVKGYHAYKNNVIVGYLPLGKDARFAKIYFISLEQIGMQNAKL